MFLLGWILACAPLPACAALCDAQADGIDADVGAAGATWQEWTGFDDREAWTDACHETFTDSLDDGGDRGGLRRLCRSELDAYE